ncbi:hypothetical protein ACS0TY_005786 [Phlomoides rotata]
MSEIMASMPLPWVSSSKTERTSLLSAEATRPPTSVALVWKLHPTEYSREGAKLFNFRDDTLTLLLELRIKASSGSSDIKIGVGTRYISGGGGSMQSRNMSQIYGLAQCIPDLSLENCSIYMLAQLGPRY